MVFLWCQATGMREKLIRCLNCLTLVLTLREEENNWKHCSEASESTAVILGLNWPVDEV